MYHYNNTRILVPDESILENDTQVQIKLSLNTRIWFFFTIHIRYDTEIHVYQTRISVRDVSLLDDDTQVQIHIQLIPLIDRYIRLP